jgi:hypothetical protein
MAVTSKSASGLTGKPDAPVDNGPITPSNTPDTIGRADADRQAKIDRRECVVDDGTAHMGRATPGALICSAHAMRYNTDGTLRGSNA